ncbi:MAG: hypothetical protein CMJ94_04725 [Planctomycetes bacterium]|nr:hypothetical protein [Planctomycetota bacterium]
MADNAQAGELQFACASGLEALRAAAPGLDALLAGAAADATRPSFFASSNWLIPWASHCCEGAQVFLFTAALPDGELVAALPMALQPVRLGGTETTALTILGWPVTDNFELPARSAADRAALLRWAWQHARRKIAGWSCWMLREIDEQGPTAQAVQQLVAAGELTRPEVFPAGVTPVLDLEAFHAEDGDPRTKKQVYRITKFRRKLARAGEVEVPFWRVRPDELEQVWQNAVSIESRSWKGEDGDATALQGGAEATMLREVWERVVPAEQLACCEVHLDGQPLASHWGFVDGDRFLSFHMAYDNEYRSYGLGSVMLEDMVQHGREIGLRWIDASRGNTAGTHILGQYGGPIRQQVQLVLPRRSLSGLWVRMRCKARQAKARRAEAEAAAAGKA